MKGWVATERGGNENGTRGVSESWQERREENEGKGKKGREGKEGMKRGTEGTDGGLGC